jgi:NADP-dependent 3-hydroxy acid dehydrogenase YdfG
VHSSGCGFTRAVILSVRDAAKVRSVVRETNEVTPNTDVILTTIHLDDFTSVVKATAEIAGQVDKIDVLINNACIMAIPWATNKARIEKQLA